MKVKDVLKGIVLAERRIAFEAMHKAILEFKKRDRK
jgi:hypothetical protein